jgi:cellulose synthase/poly-beta-1,6-N-acetylglucosamine synthase-like glycosyltransferase
MYLFKTSIGESLISILSWIYLLVAVLLAIYSGNMLFMTALFWFYKIRTKVLKLKPSCSSNIQVIKNWPAVTVQLPMYNEQQVARRLIDAVARLDYPVDKLQIQVLDDSTDTTRDIVDDAVNYWSSREVNIVGNHRVDRQDYKAGALKDGLKTASGEFIAIFDADFVPPRDWLKRAMCPFLKPGSERLGLVQTRWSHINEDYSLLTRAQALGLDGTFGIEQNIRTQSGFMLNFNGTAGIWRRSCIEDAGNWRGNTLTEDLDLSYRAQLKGWKAIYLLDVYAPAELPTLMLGFKRQQFRWTKGSIQTARLLGFKILKAPIDLIPKIHGLLHITYYLCHPLMILFLILTLPLLLWGVQILHRLPIGWLSIVGMGPPLFFISSQIALYQGKKALRWFVRMPLLAALGIGITVNNSRAVFEALRGKSNTFERTPKLGVIHRSHTRHNVVATEKLHVDSGTILEVALCFYAVTLSYVAIHQGDWFASILFLLYATGYGWVAGASIWEAGGIFIRSKKSKFAS